MSTNVEDKTLIFATASMTTAQQVCDKPREQCGMGKFFCVLNSATNLWEARWELLEAVSNTLVPVMPWMRELAAKETP